MNRLLFWALFAALFVVLTAYGGAVAGLWPPSPWMGWSVVGLGAAVFVYWLTSLR